MTESQFQAKLLKALRAHPALKDAVIFKHSDRVNGGIPDVSITVNGNTSWFELKVAPNRPTKLQWYYLTRLKGFLVALQRSGGIVLDGNGHVSVSDFEGQVAQIVIFCVTK